MSRINTNVQSLIAQRTLTQNQTALGQSLERLSTGLRINRGKDDPAGLIASQRLDAEATGLNSAIDNANRADQVVKALRVFNASSADFADCLIERTASAVGCTATMTFDVGAAKSAGMTLIR